MFIFYIFMYMLNIKPVSLRQLDMHVHPSLETYGIFIEHF